MAKTSAPSAAKASLNTTPSAPAAMSRASLLRRSSSGRWRRSSPSRARRSKATRQVCEPPTLVRSAPKSLCPSERDRFAVDQGALGGQVANGLRDPRQPVGEIRAMTGPQPDALALPPGEDSASVVLDLVQPVGSGGRATRIGWRGRTKPAGGVRQERPERYATACRRIYGSPLDCAVSTSGLEVETRPRAAVHVERHRAMHVHDLPFAVFLAKTVRGAEPQ